MDDVSAWTCWEVLFVISKRSLSGRRSSIECVNLGYRCAILCRRITEWIFHCLVFAIIDLLCWLGRLDDTKPHVLWDQGIRTSDILLLSDWRWFLLTQCFAETKTRCPTWSLRHGLCVDVSYLRTIIFRQVPLLKNLERLFGLIKEPRAWQKNSVTDLPINDIPIPAHFGKHLWNAFCNARIGPDGMLEK